MGKQMILDKNKILAADDIKLKELDMTAEWGGVVYMRTLSGSERDAFEDAYSRDKMKNFRVRFLVLALSDDKGERLFTDAEVDALGKKSSAAINKAFEACWALNAFTPEAVEALGEGSPDGQSDGSISA